MASATNLHSHPCTQYAVSTAKYGRSKRKENKKNSKPPGILTAVFIQNTMLRERRLGHPYSWFAIALCRSWF